MISFTKNKMKILYLIFIIVFFIEKTNAQDTIKLLNGNTISVKVLEVNDENISYQFSNMPTGPLFIKNLTSLIWVKYSNNIIDSFHHNKLIILQNKKLSAPIGFNKYSEHEIDSAVNVDVKNYYKYKDGTTIFFSSILLTPVIGGIIAEAVGSTPPKDYNLNMPISPIAENGLYKQRYKMKAHKVKKDKVGTNFGAGIIISFISLLAFLQINN